jgi:uroporphyrinogen III methyltransferase/synthase
MTPGRVALVGAGPGDPGLITVAGLERVRGADVIVYDRLASEYLLKEAKEGAELLYVGKLPGDSHDQGGINQVLVDRAREGKRVVRLKGGDPFVFGRGGEEAEALREAGIPFEVIPGVTSSIAVPAYAGIPVTHRGVAVSFAVITGHEDPTKPESAIDWSGIARGADTLVFLMGVKNLPDIVANLAASGRAPDTPVAVIQQGTTTAQRTVTGTLGDIVQVVQDAGITPPAITVVGEVVRLRETLSWFENRPLFGKRVLITRTRRQASVLARLLAEEGAIPVELPSIEIEPVEDRTAIEAGVDRLRSGEYDWAGFTSANAVELFFELIAERDLDARVFGASRVFAIGPATAAALAAHGITPDIVPPEYVAEAVVEAMKPHLAPGARMFLPRAEAARPELVQGLESLDAAVDEIPVYRAVVPAEVPPEALDALRNGDIDIVTFTSSSTVRNLVTMLGGADALQRPLIACIGPITADTARELGLRVDVMASEYTVEGLVETLRSRIESR